MGKNDVGKSTLLKAIDAFLNENNPNIEDKNVYSDSNFIEINLILILRQVQLFWMILFRYHFLMKN